MLKNKHTSCIIPFLTLYNTSYVYVKSNVYVFSCIPDMTQYICLLVSWALWIYVLSQLHDITLYCTVLLSCHELYICNGSLSWHQAVHMSPPHVTGCVRMYWLALMTSHNKSVSSSHEQCLCLVSPLDRTLCSTPHVTSCVCMHSTVSPKGHDNVFLSPYVTICRCMYVLSCPYDIALHVCFHDEQYICVLCMMHEWCGA
jgi:hypothetical protein